MPTNTRLVAVSVCILCHVIVAVVLFQSGDGTVFGWGSVALFISLAMIVILLRGSANRQGTTDDQATSLDSVRNALLREREEFEVLRASTADGFNQLSDRLAERERDLATRMARFQEIMEYPDKSEQVFSEADMASISQLSEKDKQVNRILEAEAERVYEKIRINGYWVDGGLDTEAIRTELHALVKSIARVYSPDSQHPLLETSFEQLARASSRICLHALVLLEQLPLGVQRSNFKSLYSYFQKAASGYGTYKKAAPWLTYLTRGLYAGRLASATNPVTLGAWWLATEVGKRGASKFVENMVEKQAIAVLHDLVTVVGVEVASVYGPGFRQRDYAWIAGTELVELVSRFPVSRDSLSEGLRAITALPLRNEYDRIYLYRCLANHRSTGMRLPDPTLLSRDQRENLATQLETFFERHIHGATRELAQDWRSDFESRFDIKLKPTGHQNADKRLNVSQEEASKAIYSLSGFITACCGWDSEQCRNFLATSPLIGRVDDETRKRIACTDKDWLPRSTFEPPDIDPASEITEMFLQQLAKTAGLTLCEHTEVERLARETAGYFRRTPRETDSIFSEQYRRLLQSRSNRDLNEELTYGVLRSVLLHMKPTERLCFCYQGVTVSAKASIETSGACYENVDLWLVGFSSPEQDKAPSEVRTVLVSAMDTGDVLWEATGFLRVQRLKRVFLDDAVIDGGLWNDATLQNANASLVVPGSLRGGRYSSWFGPLLERSLDSRSAEDA
ncbi:MAG: hypothetical protein R3C20_07245 [Planctomycetaceae bacterium]